MVQETRPAPIPSTADSPDIPSLNVTELECGSSSGLSAAPREWPTWEDVSRDPMQGPLHRIWDAGTSSGRFVPGLLRKHTAVWDKVVLLRHHLGEPLVLYVRDGVSVYEFLLESHKNTSVDSPNNREKFAGAVLSNRIPLSYAAFIKAKMRALVARRWALKWTDVRSPAAREKSRLVQALFVEEQKPRLIYDGRPLNKVCVMVPFFMDTVAHMAQGASEGCVQGSQDDSSGFHLVLLHPASWPLFGLRYQSIDYVWTALPFGGCESPYVYHSSRDAKTAFLRAKGISVLPDVNDSWLASVLSTQGQPARAQ